MECGTLIVIIIVAVIIGVIIQVANTNQKKKTMEDAIKALPEFSVSQQIMSCDGSSGIAVDQGRKKICLIANTMSTSNRIVSYKDILSVELFEDGDSITKTSRSSQVGGALVGGLLLGGAGAIIGGLSGKTRTSDKVKQIDLRIIVNDPNTPLHDIKFLNLESKKDSVIYKNAMQSARHWHGVLEVLIKSADSELHPGIAPGPVQPMASNSSTNSVADELKKLGELKHGGLLTEEEFQSQKRKLLDI
jgi:hypothetical protein